MSNKIKSVPAVVSLKKLIPADYNPQTIDPEAREGLKESLNEFGLIEPIIVDENYLVLGGHKRLDIMIERGEEEANVIIVTGLTEIQKKKLNVTLNNPKIKGRYVPEKLATLLEELRMEDNFETLRLDALEPLAMTQPEFKSPDSISDSSKSEESDIDEGYAPESGIKMVQLLMKQEQHPEFLAHVEGLQSVLKTENLTDTIIEAVKFAYKSLIKS